MFEKVNAAHYWNNNNNIVREHKTFAKTPRSSYNASAYAMCCTRNILTDDCNNNEKLKQAHRGI